MQIVETAADGKTYARQMTRRERIIARIRRWWSWHVWRRVPYLVWRGQEVDVCITFAEDPLRADKPFGGLFSGGLAEIENQLHNMGIRFDCGLGCDGRDWEWDYSLRGPVRVKFRGRAKNPHLRVREQEAPKPKLAAVP